MTTHCNDFVRVPATSGRKTFGRRALLKTAGLSGVSLAAMTAASLEDQIAYSAQNVNRNSQPSELRITDLRIAHIHGAPMRVPIIRIDTNQGLRGYGEVRDGGSPRYALVLKSRLLGENPCNVERLFKKIKQFGHHGRQGGGVSGVEMALWDLAGKAYQVPVYQMLGGRYRDQIRLYADTTVSRDPDEYARRMKARLDMGYTFLKMDVGINLLRGQQGVVTAPLGFDWAGDRNTAHPFTSIQPTDKGIERLVEYVAAVRQAVGYEVPPTTSATSRSTPPSDWAGPSPPTSWPGSRTWSPGNTPRSGSRSPRHSTCLRSPVRTST